MGVELIAAAIGGGVLTVLGYESFRWIRRPILRIHYDPSKSEYCPRTPERGHELKNGKLVVAGETESIWLRVKATNSGRTTARGCCVFISHVSRQNPDGSTDRIDNQDALLLQWSLRGGNTIVDLPRGINQFADVCFARKNNPDRLFPAAPNFPLRLEKAWERDGVFEVGLIATADNASPARTTIKFSWAGSWETLRPL